MNAPAPTPDWALKQALSDGDVPDGGRADAWIRIAPAMPSSVSFFLGRGVAGDGRPVPGAVVQGEVAVFAHVSGTQPGWVFAETMFHDCDPRGGTSPAARQHLPRGGAAYLLSFPRNGSALGLVTECIADTRVTMNVTGAKAAVRFDRPPTASQWKTLTDCVSFHHGRLVRAGDINPTDFGFVETVRQLGGADMRALSDDAIVSAAREICRAHKHPGTTVAIPELHEVITTTTAADGSWTWTFKPQTNKYFELVANAAGEGFCA